MREDLKKIIEHENARWTRIFASELNKKNYKKFSSFWWEEYYSEITNFVNKLMEVNNFNTILESGSGSGKATLLLKDGFQKTLLDISSAALKFAQHVASKFNSKNVNYVEGNIFSMPFRDNEFDLVWNIGVIEHYEINDIKSIIEEMIRVSSKTGAVAVAMPNLHSGPIMKARLLKLLKFIPGYKLDTEKFYEISKIKNIFKEISNKSDRKIKYIETLYFGNPLIMETPKFILKTFGVLVSRIFRKNKFLILIICKFE